ncbi:MAG TPA: TPM domain-containing protein [Acidiferrobacterales bacterium]|nr:TPM domain-containing protein [Acidiferrobacterales bacterium]
MNVIAGITRSAVIRLISVLSLLICTQALAAPSFPPLTGRVVDQAGLLSSHTRLWLTQQLEQHEQATREQVVVVIPASLQGYPIEDYGVQLARRWGIGQAKQNNGVVLIIAPNEHEVRIEVGYGLEGKLTDALSHTIIQNEILPYFKQGDYEAGVVRGTQAILAVLGGAYTPTPAKSKERPVFAFPFFLLLMLIIFSRLARGHHSGWGGYWGGGFGGGGGGVSRGGGFSGGGGSFGGGGASGRW